MTTGTVTVGEFEFDPATGTLTGPAAFMRSADYAEWLARFKAGNDPVFRVGMGCAPTPGAIFCPDGPQSPNAGTAMLVSVQTCYAAWHGREVFNRAREGAR